jgi:hypothetical protein
MSTEGHAYKETQQLEVLEGLQWAATEWGGNEKKSSIEITYCLPSYNSAILCVVSEYSINNQCSSSLRNCVEAGRFASEDETREPSNVAVKLSRDLIP